MADTTHKTKIVVEADASKAVRAFGAVRGAIQKVSGVISVFTRGMSIFGLAVNGAMTLANVYRKLQSWMNRAANAAAELNKKLAETRHATQVGLASKFFKDLNSELARTNKLEAERNALLSKRQQIQRDFEDANLEQKKQGELASLDPASPTYDTDRKAIERRYAKIESSVTAKREKEDANAEVKGIDRQLSLKQGELAKLERLFKAALATENRAVDAKDQNRINEAMDVRKKIGEQIETAKSEIASLTAQRKFATYGGELAERKDAARRSALETEARREEGAAAQRQAEEREKAQQSAAEEAAAIRREQKQEEIDERRNRISALESYDAALQGVVGPSQNRLTAMGLGAGVSPVGVGLSGDVHQMLDVLKKQLALEERQNNARGEIASLFSE